MQSGLTNVITERNNEHLTGLHYMPVSLNCIISISPAMHTILLLLKTSRAIMPQSVMFKRNIKQRFNSKFFALAISLTNK